MLVLILVSIFINGHCQRDDYSNNNFFFSFQQLKQKALNVYQQYYQKPQQIEHEIYCKWKNNSCVPDAEKILQLLTHKTSSSFAKLYKCWFIYGRSDCRGQKYCVWDDDISMCIPSRCIFEDIMLKLCKFDVNYFLVHSPQNIHNQAMLILSRIYFMEVSDDIKLLCKAHDAIGNCSSMKNNYSCLDKNECEVCSGGRCLQHNTLASFLWTIPEQQTKAITGRSLHCALDKHVFAGYLFQNSQDRQQFGKLMSCLKIRNENTCSRIDLDSLFVKDARSEEISAQFWKTIEDEKEQSWNKINNLVLKMIKNGDKKGNYEEAAITSVRKYLIQFARNMLDFPNCKQQHYDSQLIKYNNEHYDEL